MTGESVRIALEQCRDTLNEAVGCADQSYQFGPNSYAYEALMRCTNARDAVGRLTEFICDVTGKPPTKDFMRWQPTPEIQNTDLKIRSDGPNNRSRTDLIIVAEDEIPTAYVPKN